MRLKISSWIVIIALALASDLPAQPASSTNRPLRQLSLEDCIQMAVQHNLGLQVARFNPRIQQLQLDATYWNYEPVFNASAARSSDTSEGGYNPTSGLPDPADSIKQDSVGMGFSGLLPTGLRYDLGVDYRHIYGGGGTPGISDNIDTFNNGVGISVTQPILRDFLIDQTRLQIRRNKTALATSKLSLEETLMRLIRDLEVAYYELVASRDQVKVRQTALELAERLLADNKRKVEVGTLAPLDEKQAEAQVAQARADLMAARRLVLFRENALRALITDNYREWYGVELVPSEALLPVPVTLSRGESWARALERRPDFNRLKAELELQGYEVKYAKSQVLPSLDIVGGYGRSGRDSFFRGSTNPVVIPPRDPSFGNTLDDIGDGSFPNWSIGAVFSVPLSSGRERRLSKAAKEREKQMQVELQQLHQSILVAVEDAITLVESTYEQIGARREAREFAQAALDAEQKKLENGKSTSFQVLDLQEDLTSARSAEIGALSEYNKSLTELYFSEGSLLDRRKIKVE
ncbi:MAG TPA: TolC family protein [Methylomirabilota bacterium]|nr:TolC family protein [Methylomirabilota bacterium]